MHRVNHLSTGRRVARTAIPLFLAVSLFLLRAPSAAAQQNDGFYLSTNFGLTSAFGADVTVFGANHPTRCDRLLYANPASAPSDAECTAPLTSSRQGEYPFDRNPGRAQALALGYATGSLRFEGEFLLRQQVGEVALFSVGADRSLIGKDTEWSALAEPNADIYNFRSTQLFANAYYAFGRGSSWAPYLGAGAGLARLDFGFYVAFHRKSLDEGYLEVFGGSKSNPDAAPEWQRAAAGSLSMTDESVGEWAFGYQLLAGVDRALGDRATAGLKARWTSVATVSASLPWTMVRSHRPVHADGQTPFFWDYDFAGLGYLGVSLEMRYIL